MREPPSQLDLPPKLPDAGVLHRFGSTSFEFLPVLLRDFIALLGRIGNVVLAFIMHQFFPGPFNTGDLPPSNLPRIEESSLVSCAGDGGAAINAPLQSNAPNTASNVRPSMKKPRLMAEVYLNSNRMREARIARNFRWCLPQQPCPLQHTLQFLHFLGG